MNFHTPGESQENKCAGVEGSSRWSLYQAVLEASREGGGGAKLWTCQVGEGWGHSPVEAPESKPVAEAWPHSGQQSLTGGEEQAMWSVGHHTAEAPFGTPCSHTGEGLDWGRQEGNWMRSLLGMKVQLLGLRR